MTKPKQKPVEPVDDEAEVEPVAVDRGPGPEQAETIVSVGTTPARALEED